MVDGRYTVLQRIGSGGMADVWLADDTHLQRRVALKVLHARFAQDGEFVERFRREAEAAAGLQHPNVVAVFDRGDVDGTYYIAMQYLEGRTLKQLIDAGLTPEQAVGLIRQVLEGARFAHRHGVVHRDLKPQNVIVDADGKATVTDFGIARAGVSEITQAGSVMGTPHYLSPEQAQGFDVTAVSDLYSIGVMLYEALTGRVPFEADSAVAVAMKQVSQAPQRPSSINPADLTGPRRRGDAGAGKGAGAALPERRRFYRRPRRRAQGPGGGAGGTAAFAALPPVVATPEEPVEEGEEERLAPADLDPGRGRGADRPPGRLRLDPRHDHRGPQRNRRIAQPRLRAPAAGRLQRRRSEAGRARSAGQHRARAGPGRLAAGR